MIRKYKPEDCDAVVSVWAAASELAHPFLSEAFLQKERQEIVNNHLPNADTWVWEANGKVTGFISLVGNEVGAIFVDPKSARSGIGSALMDHARARHGELEVEVFEANSIGRAFYDKYGFREMTRKHHEQTGMQIVRLQLAANKSLQSTAFGGG